MDRDKTGLRISVENILSPGGFTEYPQTVLTFPTNCPGIPKGYGNQRAILKLKCRAEGDAWVSKPQGPVISLQHPPKFRDSFSTQLQ